MPPDFASEVANMKTQTPVLPVGGKPEGVGTEETQLALEMPADGSVHPEQAAKVETKVDTPPPPPKTGPIRIGTEVFETAEEAIAYATEQQLLLAQRDAYEQGRREALPKADEKPVEPDLFEELGNEFFENPQEAIRKLHAKAVADAKKQIAEEKRVEENRTKIWGDFYSANADLAANKQIVDFIFEKNWGDIAHLPPEKALKIVADKSREFLGSVRVANLPSRELQSKQVTTPDATAVATSATSKKESQALDFISQVNKHRRRQG